MEFRRGLGVTSILRSTMLLVGLLWLSPPLDAAPAVHPAAEPETPALNPGDFLHHLAGREGGGSQLRALRGFFDTHGREELRELIRRQNPRRLDWAVGLFTQDGLEEILRKRGGDFFLFLLHATFDAQQHLIYLDSRTPLNAQRLVTSAVEGEGRFTGALSLFGSQVALSRFRAVVDVLTQQIPKAQFLDTFYSDPYLVANAVRVFAERDPTGRWLENFLGYFSDDRVRGELFSRDLPGLVVSFATVHEISEGKVVPEVFGFFDLTETELAQLIEKDAVSFAYVFYGAYQLGSEKFRYLIDAMGKALFRQALFAHTKWLANYLMGLHKTSILSAVPDMSMVARNLETIENDHPHLLRYRGFDTRSITPVTRLLEDFVSDSPEAFLRRPDRVRRTQQVLLGMLALYQRMLDQYGSEVVLTETEFHLLKLQILSSTRFAALLDSASSNYEVGAQLLRDKSMRVVPLVLAHELAHQIFTLLGFDAQRLSAVSIHELSADIAARAIDQMLVQTGSHAVSMGEYHDKIVAWSDYAHNREVSEEMIISSGDEHIIGRTQLGHIVRGYEMADRHVDWMRLFVVATELMRHNQSMRFRDFVEELVIRSTFAESAGERSTVQRDLTQASFAGVSAQMVDAELIANYLEAIR